MSSSIVSICSDSWAAAPRSSPYTSICRWLHAPVADPDRPAVLPAGEMIQLTLSQIVLAADAEHDLQTRCRVRSTTPRPSS